MPIDPGAYHLNPRRERCARCGEVARGSARINGDRYCHSDEPYPTCYMREQWENSYDESVALERLAEHIASGSETVPFSEVLARFGVDE